jgi:hypothetical protein
MNWTRVLRFMGAAAGAALVVALAGVLLDAQRTQAPGHAISPMAIEAELARVYHSQLLSQGFDYEPVVSCNPDTALTFTCVAAMDTTDAGVLHTTFQVACAAKGSIPGQRCFTDTGEALQ